MSVVWGPVLGKLFVWVIHRFLTWSSGRGGGGGAISSIVFKFIRLAIPFSVSQIIRYSLMP